MTLEPGREALTEASQAGLETPFLEVAGTGWTPPATASEAPFVAETPFVSEYLDGDEVVRPEEPALRQLLEDLYDSEFDEAIADLVSEAETYVAELGLSEAEADGPRAERMLEAWIDPLRRDTQGMLLGLGEAFEAEDLSTISEARVDSIFARFEPVNTEYGPVFHGFLGSVWNKAKKLARGAIKAAKSGIAAVSKLMPIGIILRKLAALARPLLNRVLRFALNKLPVEYRVPAKLLARRFLGINVAEALDEEDEEFDEAEWEMEDALEDEEQPATGDIRELQEFFDAEAVGLVFAPSEQEQDLYLAEASASSTASAPSPLTELDTARNRFIDGVARLDEGADPTPLVENFVPAILPALRLGIRLAGRPRVVRFLAGYLGRLIAPYVGPSVTPGLSRAIVDAGLRVMTLEAEGEETEATPAVAAEAFASLVEDTVAKVARLDEEDLTDEALIEEAAYTAFQESSAANFPPTVLSPEAEFLESGRAGGTWIPMPRNGPRRYRKYSRVFNVVIHPAAAQSIHTFSGRPLSAFIRDRFGRSGPVRARIHLYQATPGSTLGGIARAERSVAGLGTADRLARSRFQPLTPMAAAALVGEPGLGREVSESFDASGPLAIGQRLYFLEVPGAGSTPVATGSDVTAVSGGNGGDAPPDGDAGTGGSGGDADAGGGEGQPAAAPGPGPSAGGAATSPRSSDATSVIDVAGGTATVTIYVSESEAQSIAARLRKREPVGASLAALRRIYGPVLGGALGARRVGRVRFRGEDEADAADRFGGEADVSGEADPETEDLVRRGLMPRRPMFGARGGRRVARRAWRRGLHRRWRRGFGWRRHPRQFRRRMLVHWIARALAMELQRNRDGFIQAADAAADGVTIRLQMRPPSVRAVVGRAGQRVSAGGPGPVQVDIKPGPPNG
jgi:hypothetical protein